MPQTSEAEQALEDENRSLRSQLEEARRGASRLGKDRDELGQRLEERDLERDALRKGKSDLEEQKRLLDRALEKISKEVRHCVCALICFFMHLFSVALVWILGCFKTELTKITLSFFPIHALSTHPFSTRQMEVMLGDSRQSVQALQSQMDEYRERSRRDLQDAQRQGKDRLAELQRAQANLKTLQEEVR